MKDQEAIDEINTVLNEWLRIRITAPDALIRIARIIDANMADHA